MNKDITILIPDGESGHSLMVARCLAEHPNLRIIVMASKPKPALRYSMRKNKFYYNKNDGSYHSVLNKIRQIKNETGFDIILPVDEPAIQLISNHLDEVSKIAAVVHIPDPNLFNLVMDKYLFAKFLDDHSIPSPATVRLDEVDQNLNQLDFPLLIKPVTGHGGHGIRQYSSSEELEKEIPLFRQEGGDKYLLQKMVKGYDIDCSLLAVDGKILAYTIQKGFLHRPMPFAAPAGVDFITNNELLDVVTQMIDKLRYNGIAHIDLRYDSDEKRYKVIELNPRYWGSLTGSLIAGVNFPYLACLAGLNLPLRKTTYHPCRYIAQPHAFKEMLRNKFRKDHFGFSLQDTDSMFILSDPAAELINFIQRRSH